MELSYIFWRWKIWATIKDK